MVLLYMQSFIILQNDQQLFERSNRKVNYDLRHIVKLLRANKILLKSGKAELILVRSKKKKLPKT